MSCGILKASISAFAPTSAHRSHFAGQVRLSLRCKVRYMLDWHGLPLRLCGCSLPLWLEPGATFVKSARFVRPLSSMWCSSSRSSLLGVSRIVLPLFWCTVCKTCTVGYRAKLNCFGLFGLGPLALDGNWGFPAYLSDRGWAIRVKKFSSILAASSDVLLLGGMQLSPAF